MYDHFKEFINRNVTLRFGDWDRIKAELKEAEFGANAHILEAGTICRHLYFLHSGILRYYEWKDGIDQTLFFTLPGTLFTSSQSFSSQTPSGESIQTIVPAQVLYMDHSSAMELYQTVPSWGELIRKVLLEVSFDLQKLFSESKLLSPEVRYRKILEEEPLLAQNVPLKYLASYLGIAPESLSRIRKRMSSSDKS